MRIVAALFLVLLLAGCSDKDNTPSGIIPRVKMEKILWDLVQADQYAAQYLVTDSVQVYKKDSTRIDMKMETLKLYEQVFRLHQVSRDEFRKSFQYYQGRPDLARGMLDTLVNHGNQLRMDSYKIPTSAPVTPAPARVPPPPVIAPRLPITGSRGAQAAHGMSPGGGNAHGRSTCGNAVQPCLGKPGIPAPKYGRSDDAPQSDDASASCMDGADSGQFRTAGGMNRFNRIFISLNLAR